MGLTQFFDLNVAAEIPWFRSWVLRVFLGFYRSQHQSLIVSIIFQIKCKYIKGSDV